MINWPVALTTYSYCFLACEANSGLLERGLGVPEDTRMAIKVEPHDNGSLFTEMHFYHRCAKLDKSKFEVYNEVTYINYF